MPHRYVQRTKLARGTYRGLPDCRQAPYELWPHTRVKKVLANETSNQGERGTSVERSHGPEWGSNHRRPVWPDTLRAIDPLVSALCKSLPCNDLRSTEAGEVRESIGVAVRRLRRSGSQPPRPPCGIRLISGRQVGSHPCQTERSIPPLSVLEKIRDRFPRCGPVALRIVRTDCVVRSPPALDQHLHLKQHV